jgi:hypothetical protein
MRQEDIDKVRTNVKDMIDQSNKGVQFLLIAHGAGIAACVAALKDYATTPTLKGVGTFIWLFSGGFVFAMVAFMAMGVYQTSVVENTFNPEKINTRYLSTGQLLAGASSALLVGSLGVLTSKLGSL